MGGMKSFLARDGRCGDDKNKNEDEYEDSRGLDAFRRSFDPVFQGFLRDRICSPVRELVGGDAPPGVLEVLDYLTVIAVGGKRIRPYLVWLAYHSVRSRSNNSADDEGLFPVLCALELFHVFALMHDDIVDGAVTRHGVLCMHKKFGVPQAILLGDLCLSGALCVGPNTIREMFHTMSRETIVGQLLDGVEPKGSALVDLVVDLKTIRYTFAYPIKMGLALAGCENEDVHALYGALAWHLGSAFQRLDDMADILSSKSELGKKPCADIEQGVTTGLIAAIRNHGTSHERDTLSNFFGRMLSDEDRSIIRTTFQGSEVFLAEQNAIRRELRFAEDIVREISEGEDCQATPMMQAWLSLVQMLEQKLDRLYLTDEIHAWG